MPDQRVSELGPILEQIRYHERKLRARGAHRSYDAERLRHYRIELFKALVTRGMDREEAWKNAGLPG